MLLDFFVAPVMLNWGFEGLAEDTWMMGSGAGLLHTNCPANF